jgi:hypothetical protein
MTIDNHSITIISRLTVMFRNSARLKHTAFKRIAFGQTALRRNAKIFTGASITTGVLASLFDMGHSRVFAGLYKKQVRELAERERGLLEYDRRINKLAEQFYLLFP